MKILIFSDSHGNVENMKSIVKACRSDTSLIVHLGDMTADFRRLILDFPDIPNIYIKGNNDFFEVGVDSEYIGMLSGVKCLFTHGHQYSVKSGISGIFVRARALRSELVLFGHTHVPFKEKRGQTLYFNPGAISGSSISNFGIIHLNNSAILSAELMYYDALNDKIDFQRGFR